MKLTDNQRALVFLDSFEKLEYKRKMQLLSAFSSPKDILTVEKDNPKVFERLCEAFPSVAQLLKKSAVVDEMVDKSTRFADGVVTLFDSNYPVELKNTPVPPLVLYYKGNVKLLSEDFNRTAIVGSRRTLPHYLAETKKIASALSSSGEVIVTGIADGGDDAAINGAISSGNLISVLAGGLDSVYPRSKINTVERIAASGLVITEYPSGRAPRDFHYPVRNRIIAGLSRAALIVSGDMKSGARHTAAYAVDYGREVAAFPYGLGERSGELCISLIKQGAILIENVDDLALLLGVRLKEKEKVKLDGLELRLYELIADGIKSPDKLIEITKLKPYEISATLGMLELKGVVVRSGAEYEIIK